jgi:hypothetical protein
MTCIKYVTCSYSQACHIGGALDDLRPEDIKQVLLLDDMLESNIVQCALSVVSCLPHDNTHTHTNRFESVPAPCD